MPQIGPSTWKVALSFFWWRQYPDGRIEQEFDPLTGQIQPWGKTPPGLIKAGWVPVTPDLARKMATHGEFGTPTRSPSILVNVKPGDELEIFKDCQVIEGVRVNCKACGHVFRSFGSPRSCPSCGVKPGWRCPKCDNISDTFICPTCKVQGKMIDPFQTAPDKWEDVVYILGIKGKFSMKFNALGLIADY